MLSVSCLQLNPQEDFKKNLEVTFDLMEKSLKDKPDLIVLPEMFTYMGRESERIQTADPMLKGVFLEISKFAIKHKVWVLVGSHAELSKNSKEKSYNTSAVFSPTGELVSDYRKIHLFHLKDSSGKTLYSESDVFLEGHTNELWDLQKEGETWKCLTTICYDLRFPELYRRYLPYDVTFVPAAFTHQTGSAHWEVLLRARAIENQCYVVAVNQTGKFLGGKKQNYGHSMVVAPWGEVVGSLDEEVGILNVQLDKNEITKARERLPALDNRKLV